MLKEHPSLIKQISAFSDCVILCLALYLSHAAVTQYRDLQPITQYWFMLVGFTFFYLYFAWTRNLFDILDLGWGARLIRRLVMIFSSAVILGASILYVIPDEFHSRTLYIVYAVFAFVLITAEKLIVRRSMRLVRRKNRNITPIILFGRGRQASLLMKEISSRPELGLRIIRKVDVSVSPVEFEEVLKKCYVEEVFFCIPRTISKSGFKIDPYLQICEEVGRPARVFVNLWSSTNLAKWEYHEFMNMPSFISHTVELDPDQLLFKRLFDIAGSLIGLAVLLAVYPVLALIIKLTSPGPIFFRQVRVGRNGKRFIIYKFRSMHIDAEERKRELAAGNELRGAVFKMKNDPRVTWIGRIMRKLSLDELPQFINVLKGEMSLVGTRPPTPDEVDTYESWHHRRISIRPGITGMWQVSGRNKITDFDEIVRLDLEYIDSWDLWLDIRIIIRTIPVLFERGSAY